MKDEKNQFALSSFIPRSVPSSLALLLLMWLVVGCSGTDSFQVMANQPRYDPLQASGTSPNGMSARPIISDTVALGQLRDDSYLYTGMSGGKEVNAFPFAVTREVLLRGQERYNIFCAPCHSRVGDGNGMVVQRGFSRPPSFHIDRLRNATLGHFFQVITNGFGRMPSYGDQIPARDRWAIIAYLRALQLSQHATLDDVPPDQRNNLEGPTQP